VITGLPTSPAASPAFTKSRAHPGSRSSRCCCGCGNESEDGELRIEDGSSSALAWSCRCEMITRSVSTAELKEIIDRRTPGGTQADDGLLARRNVLRPGIAPERAGIIRTCPTTRRFVGGPIESRKPKRNNIGIKLKPSGNEPLAVVLHQNALEEIAGRTRRLPKSPSIRRVEGKFEQRMARI
jgi:hypothetical protein